LKMRDDIFRRGNESDMPGVFDKGVSGVASLFFCIFRQDVVECEKYELCNLK
jgi:hypothetical protein